ncbi:hypothetical protein [Streptomyces sp. 6-11-2]|uniref:hypothetical protein n=1 Tax=Streptomyces sp. 6-11-2 TaxID=2585753 RepID=UPI0011434E2F|nr:hypothetical protein [Streptomyces sp. 6-11-2]GED87899.1 hypothetical protein TNCT6_49840 [Streptomyces sp. 6-11-2]
MKHLHPLHATPAAPARAPHRNGRAREAFPHARQATATGYRKAALKPNPGFSPLIARTARTTLKSPEAAR